MTAPQGHLQLPTMIQWNKVHGSSRILAEAYDAPTETIVVRFTDGVEWSYSACPRHVWDEFKRPDQSRGKYIAQVLDRKPHGPWRG